MKIKTSEATDRQLNWVVAKCEGIKVITVKGGRATFSDPADDGALNETHINYSTDWAQGGPIIERECIQIGCIHTTGWTPNSWDARHPQRVFAKGSTPLIAAMRCYVTYKLGEEVDVPDEFK